MSTEKNLKMNRFEEEQEAQDDNNFKVYVRVRPLLPREILNGSSFSIVRPRLTQVDVKSSNKTLHIYEHMNFEAAGVEEIREQLQNPKYYQIHQFNYDYIFNEKSQQEEVYEIAAKKAIDFTLKVLLVDLSGLQLDSHSIWPNRYRQNLHNGGLNGLSRHHSAVNS